MIANRATTHPTANGHAGEQSAPGEPEGGATPGAKQGPAELGAPKLGPLEGIEEGMRADQLESLGQLRHFGVAIAERLDRHARGLLLFKEEPAFRDCDVALAFSRVARAVRQIVVLEQETAGVREMRVPRPLTERDAQAESVQAEAVAPAADMPAPSERLDREEPDDADDLRDPDDTDDYDDDDDYRSGPVGEVIAQVRADLAAAPGASLTADAMLVEPQRARSRPRKAAPIIIAPPFQPPPAPVRPHPAEPARGRDPP